MGKALIGNVPRPLSRLITGFDIMTRYPRRWSLRTGSAFAFVRTRTTGIQSVSCCGNIRRTGPHRCRSDRCLLRQREAEYVHLAAASGRMIIANNTYPAEFIRDNPAIQRNLIHAAHRHGRAVSSFLGSTSCIYPRLAPQPMKEECLLTGPLEATRPPLRAVHRRDRDVLELQPHYSTKYLAVMPTNLSTAPATTITYENSHHPPNLLRKFHEAKQSGAQLTVTVWGTGHA